MFGFPVRIIKNNKNKNNNNNNKYGRENASHDDITVFAGLGVT